MRSSVLLLVVALAALAGHDAASAAPFGNWIGKVTLERKPNPDPITFGHSVFARNYTSDTYEVTIKMAGVNNNGTRLNKTIVRRVGPKKSLKVGSTKFGSLSHYRYRIVAAKKIR